MVHGPTKLKRRTILDETQWERDFELARYLKKPVDEISALTIDDGRGPPIWNGDDLNADSYDHLYEDWKYTTEAYALRAFSRFIVTKRAPLVKEAAARAAPLQNKRVLDFGCGVGSHGIYFLESGAASVDFLDVNGPALRFAKWRLQQRQYPGEFVIRYPANALPSDTYDVVLAIDVMEHLAEPVKALRGIAKAIRKGGLLVLQVGMHLSPHQGHFKRSHFKWLAKKAKVLRGTKFEKLRGGYFFRRR